jgi:chromosome segregation ATPase
MDLKQQILVALGLDKQEEVSLEFQAKLEDGTIIVSTADSLEAGVDVSVLTEDGTTMLLPVGEYKTEDGQGFSVEEEGVVAEIYENEEEVVEEEATEETEKEEMNEETEETTEEVEETEAVEFDSVAFMDEVKSIVTDLIGNVNTEIENLKTELAELKSANEELSSEKEKLSAQVVELSNEPAASPVDINKFSALGKELSSKDIAKMSKRERILYNITK